MTFLGLPADASPRLKGVHYAQLGIVSLTMLATFLAAVVPQKHKIFTFGLLYSSILTAISTTVILRREQQSAAKGLLIKNKYMKYQFLKFGAAIGLHIVGFIMFVAITPLGPDNQKRGEQGLWMHGYKVNKYQGWILWLDIFSWLTLWASLFYSCCMTSNRQGAIALAGDEADLGVDAPNDEEYARRLQAQDPNWQS
ncbi:hypothetical protein FB567DRAFT_277226 [Paraphoma chrysanthemicola]|uniref:Uncharacterized protein n=1 Tax=Paraphoma chrysanthemicola TaxID=798071 RepID=A0A8K0REJ8_9PLEO|nr:hypothetical protein FB567DRAFT_277226 [Paraphoma chrysanthemicola]